MQLLGHGIDIVLVSRVEHLLKNVHADFLKATFTDREQQASNERQNRSQFLAGRFAAKEAALKALGTGFGCGIAFTDIEILNKSSGQPELTLSGAAESESDRLGISMWLVSISHDGDYAIASVIAARAI